jgi:hypothetical protein
LPVVANAGAVLELLLRAYKNTVAVLMPGAPLVPLVPLVPFCTSKTGVLHSVDSILSVDVAELAVATVTYSGFVPVGIAFNQLLAKVVVVILLVLKL